MRAFRSSLIAALASLALGATSAARAGTIQQTIQFPGVAPEAVYAAYMSAKGHSAMTGFPVSFYRAAAKQEAETGGEGDEFRGFGVTGKDGKLQYLIGGRILHLVPNREIVMTWHATMWGEHAKSGEATAPDCILVLTLKPSYGGTELQLVQTNIPEYPGLDAQAAAGTYTSETSTVNTDWYFRYWAPMQKYFQVQAAKAAPSAATR